MHRVLLQNLQGTYGGTAVTFPSLPPPLSLRTERVAGLFESSDSYPREPTQ